MQFVDEVTIEVKAGDGGSGSLHFRREKFIPRGGPDGGNGGRGGSVYLVADRNVHTLLDFHFRPKWQAESGKPGEGALKDGRNGADLTIRIPIGTSIFCEKSGELKADLKQDGDSILLAKAGRGGKGNAFFKSATNQTPRHTQPGEPGEEGRFKLILKLVADVGIIGFPNAGKSTLISKLSDAKPKIADYPFTTLTPNLGSVRGKSGRSFVIADIPGLIPGAHLGKGLGHRFLKHVERTRVLVHLIDPHQLDPDGNPQDILSTYSAIRAELAAFSDLLAVKPEIVVLSKSDTLGPAGVNELLDEAKKHNLTLLPISSVSGEGIDNLIYTIEKFLESQPKD
ncbi:MAG: GTPase ObgE [Bdellovibrionales bacterium]|nr:GTPase ObgE [Bdellovibrionales bacterium]